MTVDESSDILNHLLFNEALADVRLRATDGFLVNRCILASRCPVFQSMLHGPFAEASSPIVDLAFSGRVIRTFVRHVYTGSTVELVRVDSRWRDATDNISFVLGVIAAARYFGLTYLERGAEQLVVVVALGANPQVVEELGTKDHDERFILQRDLIQKMATDV